MINRNCSLPTSYSKKKSVNVLHCDIDRIHYNKKVYDMSFLGRVLKSEVKKREKKSFIKTCLSNTKNEKRVLNSAIKCDNNDCIFKMWLEYCRG